MKRDDLPPDVAPESRRERYAAYLESTAWQERRQKVLQRERYVCQGCRSERACEAHHLTYAHVFDELLWELVAVCPDCHRRAHGRNNEGHK